MKYLISIPTYNESENIIYLLQTIFDLKLDNFDVLIIDDNSPDDTSRIIEKYVLDNNIKNINVLKRKSKLGLGKAYVEAFKWAILNKYDFMISMDADNSHDPKYLREMIRESKGIDIVLGSRYIRNGKIVGWPWYRYLNSWFANFATRMLLGLKTKDVTSGFKCYSKNFYKNIELDKIISEGYAFQVEMVSMAERAKYSIKEIPIVFTDRKVGKSKISGEIFKSMKSVFLLSIKLRGIREFFKFGTVGITGTIIDLGFYNLLAMVFHYNIYMSRSISFIIAATNNYYLNRKWTFRSKNKKIASEYFQFIFISIIGLGLNVAIMKLFENFASRFENEFLRLDIPVFIAIICVFFWNYFANKYWTFKKKDKI